jgi:hypothetical protein
MIPTRRKTRQVREMFNGHAEQLQSYQQHSSAVARIDLSKSSSMVPESCKTTSDSTNTPTFSRITSSAEHWLAALSPRTHIAQSLIDYQEKYYRDRESDQSLIDYQEKYYRDRGEPPATDTGLSWAKKMIQTVWAHFFEVWQLRCDKRHELDQNCTSQQCTNKVHAITRAIYAVLVQLPAEIRSSLYFDKELVAQIDQPTRTIGVWLAHHSEPLVQQVLAEAAQTVATGHLDIREYFMPLHFILAPD